MNLAVLMTCHNRRETTLRCLRSLVAAIQEYKNSTVQPPTSNLQPIFHLFLVDDGSTDGTSEAVHEWYNSTLFHSSLFTLHLIHGNGSLFWAKGMSLAWRTALEYELQTSNSKLQTKFSHFLWLNDDVVLSPNSICSLCSTQQKSESVVVGSCSDKNGQSTYGVMDSHDVRIQPSTSREARWFNGNVVLVPHEICDKVGIISDEYSHARADYDYAERLHLAGIPIIGTPEYVGVCENDKDEKCRGLSLFARIARMWRPGYYNLHDLWLFKRKYYGLCRALISCAHLIWISHKENSCNSYTSLTKTIEQ